MQVKKSEHPEYTLISLVLKDEVVEPSILEALTEILPEVNAKLGVVVSGRAPIWVYNMVAHHYHPVAWLATHDPRIGYVVTATHSRLRKVGEVIDPNAPIII